MRRERPEKVETRERGASDGRAVYLRGEKVADVTKDPVIGIAVEHACIDYRMAEDPGLPLTDVQFVLGHAALTTTQLYLTPRKEDVVRRVLAHHSEQTRQALQRAHPLVAPGYRPESMDVLFGNRPS